MKMHTVLFFLRAAMKLWRFDYMYKKSKNIAKKVGIGLAVGAAVAAVGTGIANRNSKAMTNVKKNAGKAMLNVSEFIGDVGKMMK